MGLNSNEIIGLDVGTKRIGVARANLIAKIPESLGIINVDGTEMDALMALIATHEPSLVIVGLPKNSSGLATDQTRLIEAWTHEFEGVLADKFDPAPKLVYGDENFSSIGAKSRVGTTTKYYDDVSACIILDYYLGNEQ